MPTGYTEIIGRKQNITTREFILRCARNFGVLAHMRDEPLDAAIPDKIEPDPYYAKELKARQGRLAELQSRIEAEWQREYELHRERVLASWHEQAERARVYAEACSRLSAEIEAWQVPSSDFNALKRFALDQLEETLRFDGRHEAKPTVATFVAWKASEFASAAAALANAANNYEGEIQRAARRNDWLSTLRDSLPKDGDK